MTSLERIQAALNHRQPDRTPVDFSGHRSSGIAALAYTRLRKHLALPPRPLRVYDPIQQLAIVDDDILDLFGVDTIELGRAFALDDQWWTDWELPDGTPCQMPAWASPERDASGDWILHGPPPARHPLGAMPREAIYFEQTRYPLAPADITPALLTDALANCLWTAIASPPGPQTPLNTPAGRTALADGAARLRATTDKAIIAIFGGNLFELGQYLYRNDNFFMLLAAESEKAHAFLDVATQLHLSNLENYLAAVGPHVDIILFGDDLGTQNGPFISPAMYREFFKPRHALMWQRAKQLAPHIKVQLHSCGSIRDLLPDLIEAGLDAINPVQITCRGMDPAELRREYGRDIVFWGGGCDTRDILPHASPAEVRAHVTRQLHTWTTPQIPSPGGYVFQQVHNIMANVPPQNITAMFEALRETKA
ncbi:methyltransferase [Opitutaceae bacterium TAV4]|nr:methyltransferase [Opitutaceae bacterium TAV4]RRK00913.1 methyltransferase [Opitutaceae bacterium TAV3]